MTVLARVPVDRITARAREVQFRRVLLTILAGLLFGAGWVACRIAALVWLAIVWCAVAVKVGWDAGRKGAKGT